MNVSDLKIGTRVAVTVAKKNTGNQASDDKPKSYTSRVIEVRDDGTMCMDSPIENGRIITLYPDKKYEFMFRTDKGYFLATGQVTRNYKLERFYVMDVTLVTPLERYQRREYFRIECSIKAQCIFLTEDEEELEDMSSPNEFLLANPDEDRMTGWGTISNISGGGALLYSTLDLYEGDCIMLRVAFDDDEKELTDLFCKVLERGIDWDFDRIAYRVKFLFHNARFREKIIRFVFDEERRIRKKEQG